MATKLTGVSFICPTCLFRVEPTEEIEQHVAGTTLFYSHKDGACPSRKAKEWNDANPAPAKIRK